MKKQLLLLLVMILLPMVVSADPVEINGIYYNLISKGEDKVAEVTSRPYNGKYQGNIDIPEYVTYEEVVYRVIYIAAGAFSGCKNLTVVTIPSSVVMIGKRAFYDCSSLTSINIPSSVTTIDEEAFRFCKSLEGVYITDLEAWCNISFPQYYVDSNPLFNAGHIFLNNVEIKDLVIPNSITTIKPFTFVGCAGLTSLTLHPNITSIGYSAFSECISITSIVIPNSVTSIGNYAFEHCRAVTSLQLPSNLKTIGEFTFSGCNNLQTILWPQDLTYIGKAAFGECSNLVDLVIPDQVTHIEESAFNNCSSLTTVRIGKKVASIGERAFGFCRQLTDVYCFKEKVPSTDMKAFESSYIESAKLHVTSASIDTYKAADPWKNFGKIVALTDQETGISKTLLDDNKEVSYFTLDGKQLESPHKGVNIVRTSNGKTKKVVVK